MAKLPASSAMTALMMVRPIHFSEALRIPLSMLPTFEMR
jgi:hypothetical protein